MKGNKRLTVLTKSQIHLLYSLPQFDPHEREFFFSLNEEEIAQLNELRSLESRLHFILQLGYFKAKGILFSFTFSQVSEDTKYLLKRYFPNSSFPESEVSKAVRFSNNRRILKLLSWKLFDRETKKRAKAKLLDLVRICIEPSYIFACLLDFLTEERICIPAYSTFQDMISQALRTEEQRIQARLLEHLPKEINQEFQKLLQDEENKMYGITLLKKDAKGFNTKEIDQEIKKKLESAVLYKAAADVIPKLEISDYNIRYYAYLVDYYTADRLKELSYETIKVYLLCYIFYRFEKINDNLVNSFLYHMNLYKKQAKEEGKKQVYHHKIERYAYGGQIGQILDFFTDDNLVDDMPFGEVRVKAFDIVEKEKFPLLKHSIISPDVDEDGFRWEYYKTIAKKISRNLRPLVRALDFESDDLSLPLMAALNFIKETFDGKKTLKQRKQELFPKDFIPVALEPYIYEVEEKEGLSQKVLNVHQYEFLIYYQLEKALASGLVHVNNSLSFKSLKKDLLEDWSEKKQETLTLLNNSILNTPIQNQLKAFKNEFDALFTEVNQRIKNGENKDLKIKKSKASSKDELPEWTLTYPKNNQEINNPFYAQFPRVGLSQVLQLVNRHCHFMEAFTHVKSRYAKTKADEEAIFGCIIANATNYGILQMAEISDVSYALLFATLRNFIRLETLKEANDCLANHIADLPIFKQWYLLEEILVSSLDGKKFQTSLKHFMMRYSSKYFGQEKGFVSYSMVANNVCTNTKLIGANEHESHHFFDLIFNNTSDIQPQWHCGDTHSINRVNFALLNLLGQRFTPHLKNINKKAQTLSSFDTPSLYQNCFIRPKDKINQHLIEEEWDNLQHIFASLLSQTTTQNIIVKKLSSYDRNNKIQKALWEYDKILSDLHTLRFINDPQLRKAIRTALNRGEGYHQLTGKINSVNGGRFKGTTEEDFLVWNECSRFVANCIIYYNALLLSKIYEMQERLGNTQELEFIKRLSPIAWQHINLNGRYEFTTVTDAIDLDQIVENLVFNFKKK